jgi:hypothetical protein
MRGYAPDASEWERVDADADNCDVVYAPSHQQGSFTGAPLMQAPPQMPGSGSGSGALSPSPHHSNSLPISIQGQVEGVGGADAAVLRTTTHGLFG